MLLTTLLTTLLDLLQVLLVLLVLDIFCVKATAFAQSIVSKPSLKKDEKSRQQTA